MKNKSISGLLFVAGVVFLSVLLGIVDLALQSEHDKRLLDNHWAWHDSSKHAPPKDPSKVFVGFWVDGVSPDVELVRNVNGKYYRYSNPGEVFRFVISDLPPLYWSEIPDAAR